MNTAVRNQCEKITETSIAKQLPAVQTGTRFIGVFVAGCWSVQMLDDQQVVINLDDLPELLRDRSVVSAELAARCGVIESAKSAQ